MTNLFYIMASLYLLAYLSGLSKQVEMQESYYHNEQKYLPNIIWLYPFTAIWHMIGMTFITYANMIYSFFNPCKYKFGNGFMKYNSGEDLMCSCIGLPVIFLGIWLVLYLIYVFTDIMNKDGICYLANLFILLVLSCIFRFIAYEEYRVKARYCINHKITKE